MLDEVPNVVQDDWKYILIARKLKVIPDVIVVGRTNDVLKFTFLLLGRE